MTSPALESNELVGAANWLARDEYLRERLSRRLGLWVGDAKDTDREVGAPQRPPPEGRFGGFECV